MLEALSGGVSIVEVAERYGVSRKTVHKWIGRYRDGGLAALADRSHRPHCQPRQLAADIEAVVCELRRAHPRWGPRRLVHELRRAGFSPVPSRSTVYRVLVRHQLVAASPRKRPRSDYTRWERSASMQLWQMDIMGSIMIGDPAAVGGLREAKLISGIDDFSRYCVIATVVPRATSRAVCAAFVAALGEFGVPDQVLTDNGMQFTGKYMRPRPTEVLFDRICRHNGIEHLLTKIRSPTTTGKVERWHQSIQAELLDPHGPYDSLAEAQAGVDRWRTGYNCDRPHQARDMDTPATHFTAIPACEREALQLWLPPELTTVDPAPTPGRDGEDLDTEPPAAALPAAAPAWAATATASDADYQAIELDRTVPASGNLGVAGQQFWLGPHRAGAVVHLWMDTTTVHLALDGIHLKTLPSRLTTTDLARLRRDGAQPAGPPPAPAAALANGHPIETNRTVNHVGSVHVGGHTISAGQQHAGRRVTLRLDGDLAHVIVDGVLTRTLTLSLTPTQRRRLQGARIAGPAPTIDHRPARTQRRTSSRGTTMVIGQKIQVGLRHAGRIVTIEINDTTLRVLDDHDELITVVPRTSRKELKRHKAYGRSRNRNTG